jgi:hypothetical protein
MDLQTLLQRYFPYVWGIADVCLMIGICHWFAAHPIAYYLIAFGAICFFLLLALRPGQSGAAKAKNEALLLFSMALALFACRWPIFLYPRPLNPDEGMWVAGALKATVDPAPWRGFDAMTSGPLCTYLLALPALFGWPIGFVSARIIGTASMAGTMFALYYAIKWIYDGRVARLALVPAVIFLSLALEPEFIHFSSEYLPMFLTTVALAAAAFLVRPGTSMFGRVVVGAVAGLCLGATGFAKLQCLPIALVVLFFVVAGIFFTGKRSRRETATVAAVFIVSLGAVPLVIACSLLSTGTWNDAIISYIRTSIAYVAGNSMVGPGFFFGSAPSYTPFLVGILVVLFLSVGASFRVGAFTVRGRWLAAASFLLLLSAVYAIIQPCRPYSHYLLFSIVPLSCCLAGGLVLLLRTNFWKRHETFMPVVLAALFLLPAMKVAFARPNQFVRDLEHNSTRPLTEQAQAIARYASPGERVAVWGWMPEYYVQTSTIMATRDPHNFQQLAQGPYNEYFRRRYLADLQEHLPRVFVDAVAPDSTGPTDRATQGHECFPALAALIREHYELKEEIAGVRIYVLSKG